MCKPIPGHILHAKHVPPVLVGVRMPLVEACNAGEVQVSQEIAQVVVLGRTEVHHPIEYLSKRDRDLFGVADCHYAEHEEHPSPNGFRIKRALVLSKLYCLFPPREVLAQIHEVDGRLTSLSSFICSISTLLVTVRMNELVEFPARRYVLNQPCYPPNGSVSILGSEDIAHRPAVG